ncbi:methyl-accepting chemotaxis protein [Solirhodobacter olei]|uniref:methyl-accepting chemotaxis protein n=1 Tax=Solirhodobacter olei TaxID=2493082 RepID=UPI000FDA5147|nr:methyl-accepting chemotaxis protein [Solirhodobacter olei]
MTPQPLRPTDPGETPAPSGADLDALARAAASLGRDIVDVAGHLDAIDRDAAGQIALLAELRRASERLSTGNRAMGRTSAEVAEATEAALGVVEGAIERLRLAGSRSRTVAEWVQSLQDRMTEVGSMLSGMTRSNDEIASIARQVTILAINAKIEAARAGEAGRGFAVVAEEINALASKTGVTAAAISGNLGALSGQVGLMRREAGEVAGDAAALLADAAETDQAMAAISAGTRKASEGAGAIAGQAAETGAAAEAVLPAVEEIEAAARSTAAGIHAAHRKIETLVDTSEALVQGTVGAGGESGGDRQFIELAMTVAADIGRAFEQGIARHKISEAQLFDSRYRPVPGTDPQQVTTGFTAFTDQVLPALQEPVLARDHRIVFCAAIDRNGYLPTHNRKFSQPQGPDPAWNAAHCRNRRIFDDRVGLKAGRSTAPFLLQVYRRDMGGGEFAIMKDLSAPIRVNGRHWGALRLAYSL